MNSIRLTVSEFNEIMTDIIHNQLNLNRICISGEISQLNYYAQKQHLYITLKHEKASLQCVIYNQDAKDIPLVKQGDKCEIIGQCKFLKNKGQLIFSGVKLIKSGIGQKFEKFEKLKKLMSASGMFDIKQKKDIPEKIYHIALITADNSAAFHDFQSILNKNPHTFTTSVIPATMQGLLGASSIKSAIETAERLNPNIICITRGGGAEEDFACYNEEDLCDTITNTQTPIITGIGHQINVTLSCLCSNNHFETPTALAQYLCLKSMENLNELDQFIQTLEKRIIETINLTNNDLSEIKMKLSLILNENASNINSKLALLMDQLSILNPLETLKKGYVHCSTLEKKPLKSIQEIKKDDTINLTFWNGNAKANVTNVNTN